jgi:hypothetical protein
MLVLERKRNFSEGGRMKKYIGLIVGLAVLGSGGRLSAACDGTVWPVTDVLNNVKNLQTGQTTMGRFDPSFITDGLFVSGRNGQVTVNNRTLGSFPASLSLNVCGGLKYDLSLDKDASNNISISIRLQGGSDRYSDNVQAAYRAAMNSAGVLSNVMGYHWGTGASVVTAPPYSYRDFFATPEVYYPPRQDQYKSNAGMYISLNLSRPAPKDELVRVNLSVVSGPIRLEQAYLDVPVLRGNTQTQTVYTRIIPFGTGTGVIRGVSQAAGLTAPRTVSITILPNYPTPYPVLPRAAPINMAPPSGNTGSSTVVPPINMTPPSGNTGSGTGMPSMPPIQ